MYCTSVRPLRERVWLTASLEGNREMKATKKEDEAVTVGCSGNWRVVRPVRACDVCTLNSVVSRNQKH